MLIENGSGVPEDLGTPEKTMDVTRKPERGDVVKCC